MSRIEKSNRAIAAEIDVSPDTVDRARKSTARHQAVAKRIGRDGKARTVPQDAKLDRSFKRAQAAQKRFEARGGTGPSGPIFQWSALLEINERCRPQYEAGDCIALFAAIRKCANHDLVMPRWVAMEFIRGYDQVLRCNVKSWDEAFGLPYGKHANLKALHRRRQLRFKVHAAVRDMVEKGRPIDMHTFAIVGEKFGISGTIAGELYYQVRRICPPRRLTGILPKLP